MISLPRMTFIIFIEFHTLFLYNLFVKIPDYFTGDRFLEGGFFMSTLDATISMLEAMPEDARIKVFEFTQQLFTSRKPANPFIPASTKQVLSDLAESRRQIDAGEGLDMEEALHQLGKQHGLL